MNIYQTAFSAITAAVVLAGCSSNPTPDPETQKEYESIRKKIAESRDPKHAFEMMRKYAMENISDLTDEEQQFITAKPPVIDSNYDQTQYSFSWKIGEQHFIEVLTTPAPFMPISAMRVKRIYYP